MPTQDIQMFKDAGIAARGEGNFVVFNGPDEQFVSGRVIGADGGIGGTYAVMPELFLKMNELIEKGDIPAARENQYKADRIIYKVCEAHGNLYAVMKEILRRMYGLDLGGVRAPLPGLIPEDEPIVTEAQKMILQIALTFGFMFGLHSLGLLTTQVQFPIFGLVDMGLLYYPIAFFGIIFLVNAVNLTDGLDGLCTLSLIHI